MLDFNSVILDALSESANVYITKVAEYQPEMLASAHAGLVGSGGIPHFGTTPSLPERYSGRLSGQYRIAKSAGLDLTEIHEAIKLGAQAGFDAINAS